VWAAWLARRAPPGSWPDKPPGWRGSVTERERRTSGREATDLDGVPPGGRVGRAWVDSTVGKRPYDEPGRRGGRRAQGGDWSRIRPRAPACGHGSESRVARQGHEDIGLLLVWLTGARIPT
jgi:hypothetical protein